MPMKSITCQVKGWRSKAASGTRKVGCSDGAAIGRGAKPDHSSQAARASSDQLIRLSCQLPSQTSSGTLSPAPRAPPKQSAMVYSPVSRSALCGSSRLTRAGSSVPAIPIAPPAMAEPRYSKPGQGVPRTSRPVANSSSAALNARSLPRRLLSQGASGAARPRHSTGKVVKRPAAVADSPALSCSLCSRGATEDMAGRRLSPTTNINRMKLTVRRVTMTRTYCM